MTPNPTNKRSSSKIRIPLTVAGGVLLLILVHRLTSPSEPTPEAENEYTFQPEPRQATDPPRLPSVNLGASSGALGPISGSAPAPLARAASCASLQQFANYEYDRRFRDGKLANLLRFSGFESLQPSISATGVITCSGGDYLRRSANSERTCKNVIITYDTRTNTLSHNVQYSFLEAGLTAQCSEGKLSDSR